MIRTIAIAVAACLPLAANAADLTIKLSGAHNAEGALSAAIYASKEAFPKEGQQVAGFRQKAATETVSVTFHDLPPGRYAVTALHDENNNGKLDRDAPAFRRRATASPTTRASSCRRPTGTRPRSSSAARPGPSP